VTRSTCSPRCWRRRRPLRPQQKDIDFAFGVGQLFATVPYAQLILEEAALSGVDEALIDEIFGLLVRDFNTYAVELNDKAATTDEQARFAMRMVRRSAFDGVALRPDMEGIRAAPQRGVRDAPLTSVGPPVRRRAPGQPGFRRRAPGQPGFQRRPNARKPWTVTALTVK